MNDRQILIATVHRLHIATTDELFDAIPQFSRQKLRDTLKDCTGTGFLQRGRDDVTGQPAYSLTDSGKKIALSLKPSSEAASQPAVDKNTDSDESDHRSNIDPTAEAIAVIEQPPLDEEPVAASSDEVQRLEGKMRFILMSIRKALGIDNDDSIGIIPTIDSLIESNTDWRAAADKANERIKDLEDDLLLAQIVCDTAKQDHIEDMRDMVNHPPHYQGKVECIDAIESALGPDGFTAYCRGNAIKYAFRAGRKGEAAEDLAKAAWYLQRAAQ